MKFDEEKARQIIDKYNLSQTTLKVWKSRGSIPDRYTKEDYKMAIPVLEKGDKIMQDRLISILNMPELNRKTIIQLAGCNAIRVNGVCLHKSTFTKEEIFALQKEIKRLRLDILKYTQKYSESFVKLLKDNRLKLYVIIPDKLFARKLNYLKDNSNISCIDFNQAVEYYIKVAIQLNIN